MNVCSIGASNPQTPPPSTLLLIQTTTSHDTKNTTPQLSDLPDAFVIEAEIQTKDVAREDALALHVHSLADLKRQCPR